MEGGREAVQTGMEHHLLKKVATTKGEMCRNCHLCRPLQQAKWFLGDYGDRPPESSSLNAVQETKTIS